MFPHIVLDRESTDPLYKQIYVGIRRAILNKQLLAGVRLPSSRDLADSAGVSRNTVLNALNQLIAEGYLQSKLGSGTYVSDQLPDFQAPFKTHHSATQKTQREISGRHLSERGRSYDRVVKSFAPSKPRNSDHFFTIGVPDLKAFPFDLWARISAKYVRQLPLINFEEQSSAGYMPLREAIAHYIGSTRAVKCTPEQVIITSSSQQALFIATTVLAESTDRFWMENPGYGGALGVLQNTGGEVIHIPVDGEGLDIQKGIELAPNNIRLIYVTPSHQFPLGVTMSLRRRMALLNFAEQAEAWILEDDYDSEFQYDGYPLTSLQGLDQYQRVIYIGTFSKTLFPALRLGYMVVPTDIIDACRLAKGIIDRYSPIIPQATLAEFITEGHFTRHIRRMRTLYGTKKQILEEAIHQHLGECVRIQPSSGGMHLVLWLPNNVDKQKLLTQASQYHLTLESIPNYQALLLGFTAATQEKIPDGVRMLAYALEDSQSPTPH